MDVLKIYYNMEEDCKEYLYCGINMNRNYDEGYVDISMPNYVARKLTEYGYKRSKRQQYCPYALNPIRYGKNSDNIVHGKECPPLNDNDKEFFQQVLGSFLYYARAIDLAILHALSVISSEQYKPRERTMKRVQQLLDYLHTNPNSVIWFRSSDMILNIHSDAS